MSELSLNEESSIQINISNNFFNKTNQLVNDTEYTLKDIFIKFQDFLETDFNVISHMYDKLKELLYKEDLVTFKICNRPYLFYDETFYKNLDSNLNQIDFNNRKSDLENDIYQLRVQLRLVDVTRHLASWQVSQACVSRHPGASEGQLFMTIGLLFTLV